MPEVYLNGELVPVEEAILLRSGRAVEGSSSNKDRLRVRDVE